MAFVLPSKTNDFETPAVMFLLITAVGHVLRAAGDVFLLETWPQEFTA